MDTDSLLATGVAVMVAGIATLCLVASCVKTFCRRSHRPMAESDASDIQIDGSV